MGSRRDMWVSYSDVGLAMHFNETDALQDRLREA
jgi:hypothetical protein